MGRRVCKFLLVLSVIVLLLSMAGCRKSVADTEKISLGDVPPEIINIDRDPYLDPGLQYILPREAIAFDEYETEFKEVENSVILECEIADVSTLLKYEYDGSGANDYYSIEKGQGDYWSKVITPVKILKVHHKGSSVETDFNIGDVLPYMEDYFKVTSDMEEVTDEYEVGTYITLSDYYPMMEGKRYIIYATVDEYQYRDLDYEVMLFPSGQEASVCLDEDTLHAMRRSHYENVDIIHYIGAWVKYSGKDAFDYSYADVFTEQEKSEPKITHIEKSKLKSFNNLEEKDEYFKTLENAVIIRCLPIADGEQVKKTENNSLLADYEKFTMTSSYVNDVVYAGEKTKGKVYKDAILNVCELYYEDVASKNSFITHNRYYPMEKTGSNLLYAYVSEYEGETVLIPAESVPVIPSTRYYIDLPEHRQVLLGPGGVIQWCEYWN